jgi:hypothetical protein
MQEDGAQDEEDPEAARRAAVLASVESEVQGIREGRQLSAALAWLESFLATEGRDMTEGNSSTDGAAETYSTRGGYDYDGGDDDDLNNAECSDDHPCSRRPKARILQAASSSSPNVSLPFGGLSPVGASLEVGFVPLSPCPNATLASCGVIALDYQVRSASSQFMKACFVPSVR